MITTTPTARQEILRVAAIDAAFSAAEPSDVARLTAADTQAVVREIGRRVAARPQLAH